MLPWQEFEDICNFVRLEQIHNLADAFIMVVMSPGTKDGICFRKDNNEPGDKKDEKSYDEIEAYFDGKQCRGLMDKPKLLIFHTYEKGWYTKTEKGKFEIKCHIRYIS